jgi:enolase
MKVGLLEVFDSRGESTVQAYIKENGFVLSSFAPSGKSKGIHEVNTFPKSVKESISFFNENKSKIEDGFKLESQSDFDNLLKELDPGFNKLGGSSTIALSFLFLKYKAWQAKKEVYEYLNPSANKDDLPKPLGNVLGGGLHSNNSLPVQEILITHNFPTIYENVLANIKVYKKVAEILRSRNIFFGKNDEGAISAMLKFDNAMEILNNAISELKLDTKIGFDFAANSFFKNGIYNFENKNYTEDEFVDFISNFLKKQKNILYLEDPFDEESFDAFAELQKKTDVLICGDDLYTTNKKRLQIGLEKKSANAILIKPNQVGTLTDAKETLDLAKKNNIIPVISHRSGSTRDPIIAHLAVGWKIPYIKTGLVSGERMVKLNELIRIEHMLK